MDRANDRLQRSVLTSCVEAPCCRVQEVTLATKARTKLVTAERPVALLDLGFDGPGFGRFANHLIYVRAIDLRFRTPRKSNASERPKQFRTAVFVARTPRRPLSIVICGRGSTWSCRDLLHPVAAGIGAVESEFSRRSVLVHSNAGLLEPCCTLHSRPD